MDVPIKPTTTPNICLLVDAILKIEKPNKMVLSGTKEFNTETTALSICVSAMAKKNAGIKEPKTPEIASHFHWFGLIVRIDLIPNTNKNRPVIMTRKAPNWKGVKPSNDFLIKINELPQIIESKNK